MPEFLLTILNFVLTVTFLVLGGMLLLAGRKYTWILLGAGGFLVSATIAAEIQGLTNGWALLQEGKWLSLLIAFGIGALGILVSQNYKSLAIDLIGFAVGLYIASWFDEILLVISGENSSDFTWWVAMIFLAVGLAGIWATRRDPDQALILISVLIGASSIANGLNLDSASSFTAVITLGLALTGVVVQYATLLRERPRLGQQLPPVPHPISEEIPFE
jgi:hypothetical protein